MLSIATLSGLVLLADSAVAGHVVPAIPKKTFSFDGDSAVGNGISFGISAGPGSKNNAFGDIFPHIKGDPGRAQLRRQKLKPVGTYPRACQCHGATTVVRLTSRSRARSPQQSTLALPAV